MLKVAENIKPKTFLFNLENIYFPTMPVGFNFNLTVGLKPQVGGIKIVTVYKRSIFQVEWLIATLIATYIINQYRLYVINQHLLVPVFQERWVTLS